MAEEEKRFIRSVQYRSDIVVPPLNFAMVSPGVYRSGYPNSKNFPFLKKIHLRSIVFLSSEPYLAENQAFTEERGIQVFRIHTEGNLEPFVGMTDDVIFGALEKILDPTNHPLLIHCNKGNHRTGCIVGCLRRMQSWSLAAIFDEYKRFTGANVRALDYQVIELFEPQRLSHATP
eukprot:m.61268 g.61268  ORF g.61268 m.61268 type:complete len:175 (-) comp16162_c0_seq3:39-563(-)